MERYDAAIVGSGPAGLAAAINLKIRQKRFVVFGSGSLSKKVTAAPKVDNYLGLPGITGENLAARYREHLLSMDISLTQEQVITIYPMGDFFALATAKNSCEASCVILAPGAAPQNLLPGEERFLGRGVGYCATCDAPLFRGKTVAILGLSDEAAMEANFVSEIAGTVYYISQRKPEIPLNDGIIVLREKVAEIIGSTKAEGLRTNERIIPVDGVFVLRDNIAPSSLVPGLEVENGFIKVDGNMSTNLPGLFAAGDCTGKPHQLMRATGQGQTAALNAAAYIDELKSKEG